MATYEYRCPQHGLLEAVCQIGTAPESLTCTVCGREAGRVFSPPMLSLSPRRALFPAIEKAEKSRDEPAVVTSLPPTGARRRTPMAPLTPALRRLPRP